MIKKLQRRFALSRKGAVDTVKASLFCALQNISFMLPVSMLYFLVGDLMGGVVPKGRTVYYAVGCAVCCVLLLLTTWFQYNSTFLTTYTESGVRRIALAEKLRKIPLSFFGKKDLADLTSSIMNDCAVLETSQSHFVEPLIGACISTVLIGISCFFFDWRMALAALWPLPVSFAIVIFSGRVQNGFSRRAMAVKIAYEDGLQEYMETMGDLRSNNATESYLAGLDAKAKAIERRAVISEFGAAAFVVPASMMLKLGIATVALTGSTLLVNGTLDILSFFMFLLVVSRLYDPLEGALQNLAAIINTNTNIARMNEILDHPVQTGADALTNQGFDVAFDHVGFSYNKGETILRDVSFTAKQGEVTALVGPSGGGKTTASRLASRFWDIDKGRITVGGMDVSKIDPETLMSLYSIVFQDVTLFDNTIMENIRIGRKNATDEEVIAAARLANVHEFAEKLPEGWRISIARAFLKDAPIILLDEATASLDVENETLIQAALSRLIADKTVLVIAHRMRTVAGADQIVVLADGTVAEKGSPEALMQRDGLYAHMVKLQTENDTKK